MIRTERGAIVVVALLALALLSVLAGAWLRVVAAERDAIHREERVIQAEFLADGAVERVLAWFADPSTFGGTMVINETGGCRPARDPGEVFLKRCIDAAGLPGFKSADGHAQFAGTWDRPDLIYSWDPATDLSSGVPNPVGDAPPRPAWPPAVRGEVRILAPDSPDAVATVVSRVMVGADADVTMRVELIAGPWRGIPGAIHAGAAGAGPFPVRVHWGDVFVEGPLDVREDLDRLPRHRVDAPVNGEPYVVEPGADRWFEVSAGGKIFGPPRNDTGFAEPYAHLHEDQAIPKPGVWGYEALKDYAKRDGRYFTTRGTGLLYPDDREPGLSPGVALGALPRDGKFVFVDTLDRRSPGTDNMETLRFDLDRADADAYVGAHVVLTGFEGRSVVVDAPSADGAPSGAPVTQGVTLARVHHVGALLVAGTVETRNRVNVFGAVAAGRGFVDTGGLELWYDSRLATGYRRGFAPVLVKPGSRRRIPSPDAWGLGNG
jgi:hypothetical protein